MNEVIVIVWMLLIWASGFLLGVFALFGYMIWRIMQNMGDKSNLTNAQRVLAHVVLHPLDFGKMYYLTPQQLDSLWETDGIFNLRRPFWYVDKDEFAGVVKTRP